MIGIIDYGAGNLASVHNAFEHIGHDVRRVAVPAELAVCERALLPGVGSFRAAMEALHAGGWFEAIRGFAATGKPLLGICLGMQLLFDHGEEHGPSAGLGLIPGEVIRLTPAQPAKVPHVGWNSLLDIARHPLLAGVKPNIDVYFVHSFHCVPREEDDVIARCDFGGKFVAAVVRDNVAGMQYHPEKSQPAGVRMLENFAEWDGTC
jgi:glutamine amidotransferase